jgi:hypothetical protein
MEASKMLTFQAEIDAFNRALPDLLRNHREGDFAILKDSEVRHVCASYEEALQWGYSEYGLDEEFFVKRVCTAPEVAHFRRR